MTDHELALVQLDRDGLPMLFQCSCGRIASPVAGAMWTVTDNGDGTVGLNPSVDWRNDNDRHGNGQPPAHRYYGSIPVGRVDLSRIPDTAKDGER